MTNQSKSIETFQSAVDQVATTLAEAKKLEDETLKKTKAETALLKVESTKTAIETAKDEASKKLKALEGKTDATSKAEISKLEAEIKEYEEMLTALNESKTELTKLKTGITTEPEKENEEKTENTKEETNESEKTDRNRIQRQWDGVTSKEEWNTNPWANVARIAWGIGIVAVWIRGIKKLFGIGKKKEKKEKTEGEESTEEKGFWERPFGKFLKWTGIVTWSYYLAHGLYTGKRSLSDFFDRNKRNETNPETLKDRYEKNVDAALKPKYESFGETVDKYHANFGSTDSLWILENDKSKEIKIPKWCLPAVLDDTYDDVWGILDTDDYIFDKWRYAGQQIWDSVTIMWGKIAWAFFRPLVWVIKGLKETFFDKNGEPNEEFKKRSEAEDLTRDEQLWNLMQKYGLIRTYLGDKQNQLERKYAKQWLIGQGNKNPTEEDIDEALDNDDCIEVIEMRVESSFLRKKIVAIDDNESAMSALDAEWLYNDTHSEWIDDLTGEIKKRKEWVVPDETIRERCKNAPDINKNQSLVTELNEVSTQFWVYLNDGFLKRNRVESFASRSGLNFDELWNSKANDIEIMMEEMWFNKEIERFKLANAEFMDKMSKKTLTQKDIDEFKKSIDEYFSLEQNILMEAERKNKADGRKSLREIFTTWGFGRITAMFQRVMTPTGITILVVVGWFRVFWINLPKAIWNGLGRPVLTKIKDVTFKTVWRGMETVMRRTNVTRLGGINKRTKLKIYGEWDITKFGTDLKKWRLDFDIAQSVFAERSSAWKKTKFNTYLIDELNLIDAADLPASKQASLLQQYCKGNVRKLIKNGSTNFTFLAKKLDTYHKKLNSETMTWNKYNLMDELLTNAKLTKLDDIDTIVKNIDNVADADINDLTPKQIKKLAKELWNDISILNDTKKITAMINEIKQANEVVSVLDKTKLKELYKRIDVGFTDVQNKLERIKADISAPDYSVARVKYYEDTVESIKMFKDKAKTLTEIEYSTVLKFVDNGFDIWTMSKLHNIIEIDAPWTKLIREAMENGDMRTLRGLLEDAGNDVNLKNIIKKSDVDDIIKDLDVFNTKILATWADEIWSLLKNIVKIFTKVM